ncbi:MAG: hypothetical protein ACTHKM_00155 [Tsuneonella sp.]
MPIWFFPALLALSATVTLGAGIWLLIHAHAVATLFRKHGDVVPAPRKPRASKGAVILALIVFNAGWIASVAIWSVAISGEANDAVQQDRIR